MKALPRVSFAPTNVVIKSGECKISRKYDCRFVSHRLESCVVLVAHDPFSEVCGMLRFMLPDPGLEPERAEAEPWLFANSAVPLFLENVESFGARRSSLRLCAIGGADLESNPQSRLGERNRLALRRALWQAGLVAGSEDLGGSVPRSVWFETTSGLLLVRSGFTHPKPAGENEARDLQSLAS